MRSLPWRVRWGLLVLVAAVAVHAGRYSVAPPHHDEHGAHGYLSFLVPGLLAATLVAGLQLAASAVRIARGSRRASAPRPRLSLLWLRTVAVLLLVYVVQETGEAIFAGGHEHETFALFGEGAWVVVPFAAAAAAFVCLALRGAVAVLEWATRFTRRRVRAPRAIRSRAPRQFARAENGVARRLAPRGPPPVAAL